LIITHVDGQRGIGMRKIIFILVMVLVMALNGCVAPNVKLFTDASDPLEEFTISGEGEGKLLVISIKGIISDFSHKGFFRNEPSMVQDVVSQLKLAEADPEIKALLIKIDSPGGTVTASDILYTEIKEFKERTGVKVVSVMMNVAASGGYYIALPSDRIMAHPTTVTGSVGVVFLRPQIKGLMDLVGVEVAVNKSGENKDMGSPFRKTTEAEREMFQQITDSLGKRFITLVTKHRGMDQNALDDISTARVYLAPEALGVGLVDEVGYLSDAELLAKKIAGLPEDGKVVVYRRTEYPNDNIYNSMAQFEGRSKALIDLGIPDSMMLNRAGFYYLWPTGVDFK